MEFWIKDIRKSIGITTVYVAHDQSKALAMSDRIAVMNKGRMLQVGTPVDIYEYPASRFIAEFMGDSNLLDVTVAKSNGTHCDVNLGGGLDVPAHVSETVRLTPASSAGLLIRSEMLRLAPALKGERPWLTGMAVDKVYQGAPRRYHMAAGHHELVVEVPNRPELAPLSPGAEVQLFWSEESGVAVPCTQAPGPGPAYHVTPPHSRSDCEKEVSMANLVLKTREDVEDFVRGCAFYATAAGGLPANGIASLMSEIDAGRDIVMTDHEDLADDAVTACPFLMGPIAPQTPEVLAKMAGFGFTETVNTEKDRMRKAIEELEDYMGITIDAIVPIELAGANTSAAVAASSGMGKMVLNGDYTGRAIPEIQQTTPYLHARKIRPISFVDEWGDVCFIKDAPNYRVAERLSKSISAGASGLARQAVVRAQRQ